MKKLPQAFLSFAVLAAGAGGAATFIMSSPKPKRAPPSAAAVPVEVIVARRSNELVEITAMGNVLPAKTVALFPEISGRVVWKSPKLVPGAQIAAGETLLRLDQRDYKLAVEQQRAQVERARFDLKQEDGRRAIAEREWTLLEAKTSATPEGEEMALRKPHVEAAKAALASAESGLARAQLNVERTTIVAPFDAVVREEMVDVGQVVAPQSKLASLLGTERFRVQISVPVDQLGWVDIPGVRGQTGAEAKVVQDLGGGPPVTRRGRVTQLLGELDPLGRMARLLVEVEDPLGKKGLDAGLPLLVGAYVTVKIEGRRLEDVFSLPRDAIRDGDRVAVVLGGGRLALKDVDVVWRSADRVLVRGGVEENDRVVLTRLVAPAEGMLVRVTGEPDPAAHAPSPAPPLEALP